MDANLVRQILDYVTTNPGCTASDIASAFPEVKNLDDVLDWMSSGPKDEGFILMEEGGRYYPGPNASDAKLN